MPRLCQDCQIVLPNNTVPIEQNTGTHAHRQDYVLRNGSVQVGCESICAGSTIGSSSGRSAKITQFLDCSHIVFGLNLEHSGALNRNIYCESSLTAEPRLYPQHQERHRQLAVQTLQQELHLRTGKHAQLTAEPRLHPQHQKRRRQLAVQTLLYLKTGKLWQR